MWPVNCYNSKYGKNDDQPIGHIAQNLFEISIGFADDQILVLYLDVVDFVNVHPSGSDEQC